MKLCIKISKINDDNVQLNLLVFPNVRLDYIIGYHFNEQIANILIIIDNINWSFKLYKLIFLVRSWNRLNNNQYNIQIDIVRLTREEKPYLLCILFMFIHFELSDIVV